MSHHVPGDLVRRYAQGETDIPADQMWALETHLETCAGCRQLLADHAQSVAPLVHEVWTAIEPGDPPARHRRIATWAAPAALPWMGMTILVAAMATFFDLMDSGHSSPSLVMLLAPVAPVLGVAAAWAKGLDPAYEIVSATPRAGLYLVLRRTAAVLVVVIPLLVLASFAGKVSPALWLLPSLAFTFGTLALGGLIGVGRAAAGLVVAWAMFVVGPSIVKSELPVVLQPVSLPGWGLIVVVCVTVLAVRADTYTRLG